MAAAPNRRKLAQGLLIAAVACLAIGFLVGILAAGNGLMMAGMIVLVAGGAVFAGAGWYQLRRGMLDQDYVRYKLKSQLKQQAMEARQSTSVKHLLRSAANSSPTGNLEILVSAGSTTARSILLPARSTSRI